MKRILTTLIGIPVLIYIIRFTPAPVCAAVVLVAMLLALNEYFHLKGNEVPATFRWVGFVMALLFFAEFYFGAFPAQFFPVASAFILLVALFSRMELMKAFQASAFTLFGVFYVGGLMGYLVGIRRIESGSDLLMMLFVIIWANDIFAYLIGKSLGRHKLAPVVSPKKTWEGAIGGWIFGILAAHVYKSLFLESISGKDAFLIGGVVGIAGQLGDLCESILKRAVNAKDSGSILPGHGGMLDRVDSLLFGAPAMYYYSYFILNK